MFGVDPNAGGASVKARANQRAKDVAETIARFQAGGAESLRAVAAGLNQASIPNSTRERIMPAAPPRSSSSRGSRPILRISDCTGILV